MTRKWLAGWVVLKIVYLLTCRVLGVAVLVFRGDRVKAAELLESCKKSGRIAAISIRSGTKVSPYRTCVEKSRLGLSGNLSLFV
jgi:hypothetical protein